MITKRIARMVEKPTMLAFEKSKSKSVIKGER